MPTLLYDDTNNQHLQEISVTNLGVLLAFQPAKVWVNANTDGTSDVAFNVSSLTDVATGKVGVSFTTAFAAADFVALSTPLATPGVNSLSWTGQDTSNLAVGRSDFWSTNASALVDPTEWCIAIFGTQ